MYSTVISGAVCGIDSYLMQVEVDVSDGLPGMNMVGFTGAEVKEALERVRVSIKNTGMTLPPKRITVNLSPADIRKRGIAVDLPVALGILSALQAIPEHALAQTVVIGELGLDGEVKRVRGVLPIVREAARRGYHSCIVPKENAKEGAVIQGISIYGVSSLQEVVSFLQNRFNGTSGAGSGAVLSPTKVNIDALFRDTKKDYPVDFADINGQAAVKRAVEVAAAGFHHLLMIGPPGSGKTMVAKRIPHILPSLTAKESLEVTGIYSVSGKLSPGETLITDRPFVSPHHSVTKTALIGGGGIPKPGAISLAHRGVLFLDELAEFHRSTLDLLRQPMEDHMIHITRNSGTYSYPSDFMLVAAMNPCPCGHYPDRNQCRCSKKEILRYLGHISGPILDRIDICVEAPRISAEDLTGNPHGNESSAEIRRRILRARAIQEKRFQHTSLRFNADMGPKQIRTYCSLGATEQAFLQRLYQTMNLSARGYHRILKVARTIADLAGDQHIRQEHLTEASCYRLIDSKFL